MQPEMVYFDLSPHDRGLEIEAGTRLPLDVVLALLARHEPELCREHHLPTQVGETGFEPTPQMMGLIQALCLAISGCIASVHDLKNVRRFMYAVPTEYKRSFAYPWQAAVFLAYLLVGFRMHPSDRHKEDSNSVRDIADFAMDIACGQQAHISSFLCSHRGPSVPGGSWLAESLPEDRVRRALHLQLGLVANLPHLTARSVTWLQQGPSALAAGTIFPELFVRYAQEGNVAPMLVTLARQERQMRTLLLAHGLPGVPVMLELVDPFLREIDEVLTQRYGAGWRDIDFRNLASRGDLLCDIAIELAFSEVQRLLSFRAERIVAMSDDEVARVTHRNLDRIADMSLEDQRLVPDLSGLTVATMRYYQDQQRMHPTAKAMHDTVFYYLWGKKSALRSGRFSIGLDRDHSPHQREAWRLGHAEAGDGRRGHAVVYARRCDGTPEPNRFLNTLSFRQFWR